jgi:uncharacterized OsmC-like protein
VREIPSAGNVSAQVEGDIADVDGVLRITSIRIAYSVVAPPGSEDKINRALETYAEKCPAYQSVKDCIDVTWSVSIKDA